MPPRAPSADKPPAAGIVIPAPLVSILAKLKTVNPALAAPFEALANVQLRRDVLGSKKPKPQPININPAKVLKAVATRDKPKPKQDLLAISKRRSQIRAANLKPAASIFKTKTFAEKSRFTRAEPPAPVEPVTPPAPVTPPGEGGEGGSE